MTSWRAARFALKHTIAAGVVIAGMAVCAAVAFIVGVVMLAAHDSATTFPSSVPFALVAGVMSVVLVLAPITIASELFCERARLRLWWQIPLSFVLLCGVGAGLAAVAMSAGATSTAAARAAGIATASLMIPLGVYWWALQSADWLLRTGGHVASVAWPSRFAALSRTREVTLDGRTMPVTAHFRVRSHFTFGEGAGARAGAFVLIGDIADGDIRNGMRVVADTPTAPLVATITSVEYVDNASERDSHVGLMLTSLSETEVDRWKAAAWDGKIVQIA
jgi:hypothetical protein